MNEVYGAVMIIFFGLLACCLWYSGISQGNKNRIENCVRGASVSILVMIAGYWLCGNDLLLWVSLAGVVIFCVISLKRQIKIDENSEENEDDK